MKERIELIPKYTRFILNREQKEIWNMAIQACMEILSYYANSDGFDGTVRKEGVRQLNYLRVDYDEN